MKLIGGMSTLSRLPPPCRPDILSRGFDVALWRLSNFDALL